MIDPAALRAIADELEAAQRAATTQAIDRLTELVNGSVPNESPAASSSGRSLQGDVPTRSAAPPANDQVPEAPPVAKPAAVGLPPGVASGTAKRRPAKRTVKQRLEDREKVPCPHCAARMVPKGLPIHLAKSHGIKAETQPHKCPDCERTFASPNAIGVHRRHAHGHRVGAEPKPATSVLRVHDAIPVGAKRRYLCSRCNEPFDTPEARDLHQSWHTPGEQKKPLGERDPVLIESRGGGITE